MYLLSYLSFLRSFQCDKGDTVIAAPLVASWVGLHARERRGAIIIEILLASCQDIRQKPDGGSLISIL